MPAIKLTTLSELAAHKTNGAREAAAQAISFAKNQLSRLAEMDNQAAVLLASWVIEHTQPVEISKSKTKFVEAETNWSKHSFVDYLSAKKAADSSIAFAESAIRHLETAIPRKIEDRKQEYDRKISSLLSASVTLEKSAGVQSAKRYGGSEYKKALAKIHALVTSRPPKLESYRDWVQDVRQCDGILKVWQDVEIIGKRCESQHWEAVRIRRNALKIIVGFLKISPLVLLIGFTCNKCSQMRARWAQTAAENRASSQQIASNFVGKWTISGRNDKGEPQQIELMVYPSQNNVEDMFFGTCHYKSTTQSMNLEWSVQNGGKDLHVGNVSWTVLNMSHDSIRFTWMGLAIQNSTFEAKRVP